MATATTATGSREKRRQICSPILAATAAAASTNSTEAGTTGIAAALASFIEC
jgi:hypothetical protein